MLFSRRSNEIDDSSSVEREKEVCYSLSDERERIGSLREFSIVFEKNRTLVRGLLEKINHMLVYVLDRFKNKMFVLSFDEKFIFKMSPLKDEDRVLGSM